MRRREKQQKNKSKRILKKAGITTVHTPKDEFPAKKKKLSLFSHWYAYVAKGGGGRTVMFEPSTVERNYVIK